MNEKREKPKTRVGNLENKTSFALLSSKTLVAGETSAPATSAVLGIEEIDGAIRGNLNFSLVLGPCEKKLDSQFKGKEGNRGVFLIKSRFSANLIAPSSLMGTARRECSSKRYQELVAVTNSIIFFFREFLKR